MRRTGGEARNDRHLEVAVNHLKGGARGGEHVLIACRLVGVVVEGVVAESGTGIGSRVKKRGEKRQKTEKQKKTETRQ